MKTADAKQRAFLYRKADNLRNTKGINGLLTQASALMHEPFTSFDSNKLLLNTLNGTLDLELPITHALREHRQIDLNTKIVPWAYDLSLTDKDCPTWIAFLERAFPNDEETRHYIQKLIGYSLTGLTSDKAIYYIYGVTDAGKSRFQGAITDLVGRDYHVKLMDQVLLQMRSSSKNNDEVAEIAGRRVAQASELPEGAQLNVALVKQMTGDDDITVMRKWGHPFTFRPEAKFLIDTNKLPSIRMDDAIGNRIRVLKFTQRIPKSEQDPFLAEKFRMEMPAILAWAVRGYYMYAEEGLSQTKSVAQASEEYVQEEDLLSTWIAEECDKSDPTFHCDAGALWERWEEWCDENGLKHKKGNNTLFGRNLDQLGYRLLLRPDGKAKLVNGRKQRLGLRVRGHGEVWAIER
jgi:putative DNA primase/helicase